MKYWNKNLKKMREYIPGEQPADIGEYIKLNTNENPFPPSPRVLFEIAKKCDASLRKYPQPEADEVRRIFASKHALSPENVFAGNGSDEIFSLIFRGFIEKSGLAAFPEPSYTLYDTLAEANGIKYEKIPLGRDFEYDLNPYLKKEYDLVVIANPNNPTGTYCSVKNIEAFAKSFRGLFVADEAYIDFYGGSAIDLVKKYDNIIITRSLSKSYSLAGLRVGIAAASADIIKGFMKIKDSYNLDSLAIAGAKAALNDEKDFKYNIEMLKNNKEYLEERFRELGFKMTQSRANFIFVMHSSYSSYELYEKLKENKILVRHFPDEIRSKYLRISIGTMMEIKKLCEVTASILAQK